MLRHRSTEGTETVLYEKMDEVVAEDYEESKEELTHFQKYKYLTLFFVSFLA